MGYSRRRKQVLEKIKHSNTITEDMVLPSSVANRILDNLFEDRRLRPTHVQAEDISERLHLGVILTPSLPYFPSATSSFSRTP